ncbi:hypothetical protein [Janibacter anophelis]|uniref:hypothetical protein n=1 Tax=Janibacter anophelis TaxID=319054 RepID=UPI0013B0628F|nr:hypothetical protein [Janibacter anophelis]
MSPRADGMPEGHPEKRPVPMATLTLFASSVDPSDPTFTAWGEVKIVGSYLASEVDEVVPLVQDLFRQVLAQDPTVLETECTCGGCRARGGDRS